VLTRLNMVMHGWAGYFRHAIAKNIFSMLDNFTWWRVIRMLCEDGHACASRTPHVGTAAYPSAERSISVIVGACGRDLPIHAERRRLLVRRRHQYQ
jgi:hypothetical protein